MTVSKTLYLWAKNSPERTEQIRDWLDAAILEIASSNGSTVASTTANGVAVAFMSSSMTLAEWVGILSEALQMIDNPASRSKKAVQIFR
jgi:hypothetical protein